MLKRLNRLSNFGTKGTSAVAKLWHVGVWVDEKQRDFCFHIFRHATGIVISVRPSFMTLKPLQRVGGYLTSLTFQLENFVKSFLCDDSYRYAYPV